MASPYARTLLQIVDDTLRLCNDFESSGASGRMFTRAEAIERINDVVLEMASTASMLKATTIIRLVADTNVYDMPDDFIRFLRITLLNDEGEESWVVLPRGAERVVLTGIIKDGSSLPDQFFQDTLNENQLGIWPIVETSGDVAEDAGNLRVRYLKKPDVMTLESDSPDADIPPWIHKDIKFGAAAELLKASRVAALKKKGRHFEKYWQLEVMGRFRGNFAQRGLGQSMTRVM